jgi:cytolysin-activating lysine-acyltransferase
MAPPKKLASPATGRAGTEADASAEPATPPPATLAMPGESAKPAGTGQPSPAAALGEIVSLLVQSPSHRHLFLNDLEWLVVPPVMLRQFALFRQGARPVAYASWALVNDAVERRLMAGQPRLAPAEWRSGDRVWLMDMVAPFGGGEKLFDELRARVLAGREVKAIRSGPGGRKVETWPAAAKKA